MAFVKWKEANRSRAEVRRGPWKEEGAGSSGQMVQGLEDLCKDSGI